MFYDRLLSTLGSFVLLASCHQLAFADITAEIDGQRSLLLNWGAPDPFSTTMTVVENANHQSISIEGFNGTLINGRDEIATFNYSDFDNIYGDFSGVVSFVNFTALPGRVRIVNPDATINFFRCFFPGEGENWISGGDLEVFNTVFMANTKLECDNIIFRGSIGAGWIWFKDVRDLTIKDSSWIAGDTWITGTDFRDTVSITDLISDRSVQIVMKSGNDSVIIDGLDTYYGNPYLKVFLDNGTDIVDLANCVVDWVYVSGGNRRDSVRGGDVAYDGDGNSFQLNSSNTSRIQIK